MIYSCDALGILFITIPYILVLDIVVTNNWLITGGFVSLLIGILLLACNPWRTS